MCMCMRVRVYVYAHVCLPLAVYTHLFLQACIAGVGMLRISSSHNYGALEEHELTDCNKYCALGDK